MCLFLCLHVWLSDCVSSGLTSIWKAEHNFGSKASPWVPPCTLGRCACLCQGATCHSPPHSDTLSAEHPGWTRHGQAKHALYRCLWSSMDPFTPLCNPLCLLSHLLPIWYKQLCLLSHCLQYAEVISCTVRTDTTLPFAACLPHTRTHR